MAFIKKYIVEILGFVLIAFILINNVAPDMTWINTDSDGIHYTYSAEYLYPSHKGSSPLYLLVSNVILRIPVGTEFWRMAMLSAISGIVGSFLIYLIIRKKIDAKLSRAYACIGALIYGGSALAISQNTIVEVYPLVTTVCLGIYYFCLKKKWLTSSILIGVAGAIHPTSMLVILPMLIGYKELRAWRRLGVMALFILFYLYIPLTNRPPYMWFPSNSSGGIFGFVKDTASTALMLTGSLAIQDFPKRILDTVGLVLLNFAIVGIIPLVVAFKNGKRWYRDVLFWVMAVPAIYYLTDLAPQTYVYLQPTIAFGAVAMAIGLSRMNKKWAMATTVCVCVFALFNFFYFDIGKNLDPNLSATEYYKVELAKVPDGQILMPYYGWEWAAIFRYNKEYIRDIIPVCIDTLVSPNYQEMMVDEGIKFLPYTEIEDRVERQNCIALSIVTMNKNVWTTKVTDARTYGCEIVLAKPDLIIKVPTEPTGSWHFKPSNPYDIITGSIEINEWRFVTWTNRSVIFFATWGLGSYCLYLIAVRLFRKKNAK